jgi:hypothetical protein
MKNSIKTNPKTIADLNIKWKFSYQTYLEYETFVKKFKKLNPKLKNYTIVPGIYTFDVINNTTKLINFKNGSYTLDTKKLNLSKMCSLYELFFELDFLVAIHQFHSQFESLEIDSIKKLPDNCFTIHLK